MYPAVAQTRYDISNSVTAPRRRQSTLETLYDDECFPFDTAFSPRVCTISPGHVFSPRVPLYRSLREREGTIRCVARGNEVAFDMTHVLGGISLH